MKSKGRQNSNPTLPKNSKKKRQKKNKYPMPRLHSIGYLFGIFLRYFIWILFYLFFWIYVIFVFIVFYFFLFYLIFFDVRAIMRSLHIIRIPYWCWSSSRFSKDVERIAKWNNHTVWLSLNWLLCENFFYDFKNSGLVPILFRTKNLF